MAIIPKIESEGLRLAKEEGSASVSSATRVSLSVTGSSEARERDTKDFAIEFAEYLAKSVERFQDFLNTNGVGVGRPVVDQVGMTEHWRGLQSDIYEFRKRAAKAALSVPSPCAGEKEEWKLVPVDDESRPHVLTALPVSMVFAGGDAFDKCQHDLANYVAGKTPDWDSGMIAIAIYRAMLAAAPSPPRQGAEREKIAELEAALEPFANTFNRMEEQREKFGPDHWPDDKTEFVVTLPPSGAGYDFKFGDLRKAAAVLALLQPEGDENKESKS